MPSATPLKPITGMLRKRVIRDITVGLGGGFVCATLFQEFYVKKHQKRVDDYYASIGGRASQK
ncbi:hypothetical protein BX070DRAFT_227687 [Coemansia spiralis]|nr:hypothetical protein BX070DRAFT_227687 [Coemansia spiralis]